MDINAEIIKIDEEQQLVFGWASIAVSKDGSLILDRQDDVIFPEDLEKGAYDYVLNSRDGGEMHVRKGVSRLVESMIFTPDKIDKLGLEPNSLPIGWWVGFKVDDSEVWKGVKEGKYQSFSIHGTGIREGVNIDGDPN